MLRPFKYDLDIAVVEEAGLSFPAGQGTADRLCKLGLLADQDELGTESRFEIIDGRPAPVLADSKPLLGSATEGVRFDRVGPCKALERLTRR
jgi:hypothetical protein